MYFLQIPYNTIPMKIVKYIISDIVFDGDLFCICHNLQNQLIAMKEPCSV